MWRSLTSYYSVFRLFSKGTRVLLASSSTKWYWGAWKVLRFSGFQTCTQPIEFFSPRISNENKSFLYKSIWLPCCFRMKRLRKTVTSSFLAAHPSPYLFTTSISAHSLRSITDRIFPMRISCQLRVVRIRSINIILYWAVGMSDIRLSTSQLEWEWDWLNTIHHK